MRKALIPLCLTALLLTGCSNPYQQTQTAEKEQYAAHNVNVISLSAAAAQSGSQYSAEDVRLLQSYLLTKPNDTDLSGKPYDLDGNSVWNADDLTLMLRAILGSTVSDGLPVVFMTKDISPEGLMNAYLALGWEPQGKTAVKLSTGEPPASNYLRPALIQDVVRHVNGTIVECNTAYGGKRTETQMHYQVAKGHGFTDIADVQILDENGSMSIPIKGGTVLKQDYVGKAFADYDSYLVLSHFKGHAMAGYGGAIKNISIGLGSSEGKCYIHTGGKSRTSMWGGNQTAFTESMAEAGKGVCDYLDGGKKIAFVNVMNRLSVDCDCDGNPAEPEMADIGILSSLDPVALDQACIDHVYEQKNGDGKSLVQRIESKQGLHTLEHAEEIGLGSRAYHLVMLDE